MDYPKSLVDVYLHDGKFTDGSPDGSIPPSRDPAKWANDVTDSLLLVQAWTGETPNEADLTQLKRAIDARIAAAVSDIVRLATIPETVEGMRGDVAVTPVGLLETLLANPTGFALLGAVQSWTALQACMPAELADGATIAWDLSHAQMAEVTIFANRTLAAPINMRAGARCELTVVHGAANTTLSFASAYKGIGGLSMSTAVGAVDVLTWRCTGTAMRLVGVALDVGG